MANSMNNRKAGCGAATAAKRASTIPDKPCLVDVPLLASYDTGDLRDRELAYFQTQESQRVALAAFERKAIADSMREHFQLTGSDLPADADPRQLHLF